MGERADALASHIREQREELGWNLRELNYKVKEAVDWRHRVSENPVGAVVVAAVAGFLFHKLIRG